MKKNLILWISALALTIAGACSCSSNDEVTTDDTHFQVKNFANTGCKSMGATRGETRDVEPHTEYIEYKGLTNGYLSLNHVNACFNCGAEIFSWKATISGNVIKIEETCKGMLANCICPYDLYGEIGPLDDGDYTVIIYQRYDEIDEAPFEYAHFTVSYKNGLSGRINLKE